MKKDKRKVWLKYGKFSIILTLLILSTSVTLKGVTFSSIKNDNLAKSVSSEVYDHAQNELYLAGLFTPVASFNGDLTGYAGDCPLCSGVLACHPRTNVLEKGIYFNDDMYGTVRIVATSKKYPCGTIIRFKAARLGEEAVVAVAMDRGVLGNDVDLLVNSEKEATTNVGRIRNQQFEILRLGW
ncbi:MAG: hypothetical protein RSB41_01790 [Bacilli bacterium]